MGTEASTEMSTVGDLLPGMEFVPEFALNDAQIALAIRRSFSSGSGGEIGQETRVTSGPMPDNYRQ